MQILFFCNSICRIFLRRKSLSFNSVYDWSGFSNQLPDDQSKFHIKPINGVSRCTRDNLRLRKGSIVNTLTKILSPCSNGHWGGGGGHRKSPYLWGVRIMKGGAVKQGLTVKSLWSGRMILHFFRSVPYFVIWLNPQKGETKGILSSYWLLDWARWAIHHFHIDHNAPCLTPKMLETTVIPRRNWKQW